MMGFSSKLPHNSCYSVLALEQEEAAIGNFLSKAGLMTIIVTGVGRKPKTTIRKKAELLGL